MVAEPACNDGVVHHGLIGLLLEIRLPAVFEVGGWPFLELLQLLLSRSDFDTGVNAVGGKGACAFEIPLLKDTYLNQSVITGVEARREILTLLNFWLAPDKVVETFGAGLGTVDGECEVVVLEVQADTWEVDDWLYTGGFELLWIAYNGC